MASDGLEISPLGEKGPRAVVRYGSSTLTLHGQSTSAAGKERASWRSWSVIHEPYRTCECLRTLVCTTSDRQAKRPSEQILDLNAVQSESNTDRNVQGVDGVDHSRMAWFRVKFAASFTESPSQLSTSRSSDYPLKTGHPAGFVVDTLDTSIATPIDPGRNCL